LVVTAFFVLSPSGGEPRSTFQLARRFAEAGRLIASALTVVSTLFAFCHQNERIKNLQAWVNILDSREPK
jgi:hypothetical protein